MTEVMPETPTVKVLMSPELVEVWASRDIDGHRLTWDWGQPDGDGFHTPTVTVDHSDQLIAEAQAMRLT